MNSGSQYTPTAAFVDELVRAGLKEVCFAPGSRSTPLALLFAEHPGVRLYSHIDERSAGFFALGIAKAARRPVALLCTSGTAAANFMPSVVEAYFGQVPLIVLTADRPPEARGIGSPQTIDQLKLYGDHVKWFAEVPVPQDAPELIAHARALARQALAQAAGGPPGPVHLNFPFREPLLPKEASFDTLDEPVRLPPQAGEPALAPVVPAQLQPPPGSLRPLAEFLKMTREGLIVCGPQDDPAASDAIVRLAARLGYPVLADPLSQLRCGVHPKELIVDAYDAFLRIEAFASAHAPRVVLRFGAPPTSKSLMQYLARHRCPSILFDPYHWRDPLYGASAVVRADVGPACDALLQLLADGDLSATAAQSSEWTRLWLAANARARAALNDATSVMDGLFEGSVFLHLAELLPDGATLYVGNSMPVRDLDTFFPARDRPLRFMANRGANGIDGVVSSALGASAVLENPLVLVVGDLSFLHDLGGLLAAKRHQLTATIVLINNDGGGIFSFLPQTSRPQHFEELFGTPVGLDFAHVARMFGLAFATVSSWSDFRSLIQESLARPGVDVIEIKSERRANAERHREVWHAVSRAVSALV